MGSTFVAIDCLLLGTHHIYYGIQDNPKYSKSVKRFRIGVGVIMSVRHNTIGKELVYLLR